VYNALKKNGYAVTVVQNATTSLADDLATTKRAIAEQNGPVILVGHSYGGAVITQAGNDPRAAGLVYIAAFAPDKGESASTLIKNPPPGAPVPPDHASGRLPTARQGQIPCVVCRRCEPGEGRIRGRLASAMGVCHGGERAERHGQRAGMESETQPVPAYSRGKMIPPDAQPQMAKRAGAMIVEVKGSHSIYVSQPQAVATLIEKAAKGTLVVAAR
jgi:pimeloyl-ACP methyl ester carboxylesterase